MHIASFFRPALAAIAVLMIAPAALAAELECAKDPVIARGLGFSPSPEESTEAAKSEWLKKAQAVYSDAKLETAKNPDMMCVKQGLYSQCKITAVPCGSVPTAPKTE